jgi:hypothetical protein
MLQQRLSLSKLSLITARIGSLAGETGQLSSATRRLPSRHDDCQLLAPCRAFRNHLNCGIVGTLMRGGAIWDEFLPIIWLGFNEGSVWTNAAPFGRPAPKCPIAAEAPPRPPPPPPPPRANEAAGMAKTNNAIATFTDVFDMGELHSDSLEGRIREADVGRQSDDTIKLNVIN